MSIPKFVKVDALRQAEAVTFLRALREVGNLRLEKKASNVDGIEHRKANLLQPIARGRLEWMKTCVAELEDKRNDQRCSNAHHGFVGPEAADHR